VLPAREPLLEPHLRDDVRTITFGDGGDVRLLGGDERRVAIALEDREIELEVGFTQAHLRVNLLAAVAAASAIGVVPSGQVEFEVSPGRGARLALEDGVTVIDDCYNANPMSMRAALEDLRVTAEREGHARRVAILGDMLELGPRERQFHLEIGEAAAEAGVDVLVAVGPLAAAMEDGFEGELHQVGDAAEAAALVPDLLRPGDIVLIKASRGVGLELVCRTLAGARVG
jgi:UDP-N-acetylmuramoyl-tripeptide--D-alanyl-D-alanine ligase